MPVEEFNLLEDKYEILNNGYKYKSINGKYMIEYHINNHDFLQRYANENYK